MANVPVVTALSVAMVLLCSCSRESEKEAETVVSVQVTAAQQRAIQRTVTAEGVLRGIDQSAIVPKISAPVSRFLVNRGDRVRKGQLLAVLESRDLAAAVTDAKGSYDQAAAMYRNVSAGSVPEEVIKAEADVQASKQSLDAAERLVASRELLYREGALARRLVDEASVALAQAKGQYETARRHLESVQSVARHEEVKGAQGQLESAKGKYEAARAQLGYSEIRSPISGVVADRALFAGEMASSGSPLLTVVDASSVVARVNLPQDQAAHVKPGQQAHIVATDGSGQADGKVTVVSPAIDPQSTTVEVWVQAANPAGNLRPGAAVRVAIAAGAVPDAVVVPVAALLPAQDGGEAVMVAGTDSVVHEHKVQTGIRTADLVQILSGVATGERVVTDGGVGLEDGARVRVRQ